MIEQYQAATISLILELGRLRNCIAEFRTQPTAPKPNRMNSAMQFATSSILRNTEEKFQRQNLTCYFYEKTYIKLYSCKYVVWRLQRFKACESKFPLGWNCLNLTGRGFGDNQSWHSMESFSSFSLNQGALNLPFCIFFEVVVKCFARGFPSVIETVLL